MPTLILFVDGVAVDKILGFEGLADRMPEGKEDEWPTIILARLLGDRAMINSSAIIDDDEIERSMKLKAEEMRRNAYMNVFLDTDDVFSDDEQ